MAEHDPVDKALRLFVYGPLGFAAYMRDSAPSFMELFVNRGKRELHGVKKSVEEKLGLGQPEPPPSPPLQQRVADGIGRVASQAGSVVAAMASTASSAVAAPTPTPAESGSDTAPTNGSSGTAGLPIPEYDGLSATQVIERLDGLSRGALERIRVYELAHRARRTILASIDQLTA